MNEEQLRRIVTGEGTKEATADSPDKIGGFDLQLTVEEKKTRNPSDKIGVSDTISDRTHALEPWAWMRGTKVGNNRALPKRVLRLREFAA